MASNVIATIMGNPVTLSQTIQGSSSGSSWIDSATSTVSSIFDALSSTIQGVYQVKSAIDNNSNQSVIGTQSLQAVSTSPIVPQWIYPSSSTATTGQKTIAAIIWITLISAAGFIVLKKLRRVR